MGQRLFTASKNESLIVYIEGGSQEERYHFFNTTFASYFSTTSVNQKIYNDAEKTMFICYTKNLPSDFPNSCDFESIKTYAEQNNTCYLFDGGSYRLNTVILQA